MDTIINQFGKNWKNASRTTRKMWIAWSA